MEKEIVRCKDCKHCYAFLLGGYFCSTVKKFESTSLDGFCAWGERKEKNGSSG